ncbi:SLBB domain-containing protein [Synechococcus elongatus]|uniref:SLBB domain-containing protein n=1 Tax=Synechococcus elongatus TaxID=32046 RepID=UPI0030D5D338
MSKRQKSLAIALSLTLVSPGDGMLQSAIAAPALVPLSGSNPANDLSTDLYRMGAGDRLKITVYEAPELSGDFEVLPDGTISLPLAGTLSVQGLTLDEATRALQQHFNKVLRFPIVTLALTNRRPVRVAISGEVNRPGVYTVGLGVSGALGQPNSPTAPTTSRRDLETGQATLTQVIQQAGGITETADIRNVILEREGGRGQPRRRIEINLWELLQNTDLSQDPILRDGDRILIARARDLSPEEIRNLSQASFAPATITVAVVGEVKAPGRIPLPPNTPVTQAVLAAGGFTVRADESALELVRLEPNGSVTRRRLAANFSASANSENNPTLRNGDTIIVTKNTAASASDALSLFLAPFTAGFGLFRLLGL